MQREISIAPMIDISTLYFRQFMRLLSKSTKIYTEMLSAAQVVSENYLESNLYIHPNEFPIVGQLGGNNALMLSQAAMILQGKGFSEINLNCGCPSCKVKNGSFGACLMLNPEKVREICSEIKKNVDIPVTVKCRLGVDDHDTYPELVNFIGIVKESGVSEFIIHARKALLSGLSPAQNRKIPPLRYDWVYQLQTDFPELKLHINGGITEHSSIQDNLDRGLGVMIGRLSYEDPWFFRNIDSLYFGKPDFLNTRREALEKYAEACEEILQVSGSKANKSMISKPIVNLFKSQAGGHLYRNELDKAMKNKAIGFTQAVNSIIEIMEKINPEALDS